MKAVSTRVNHTFSPIYDENSRILILGTFPSVKSREGDFYYHHPQNRFWKVLSRIFGVEVPETIEDKKMMLLEHKTAIWDVIASCEITGSSDASIKNIVPADISMILNHCSIEKIYANGNKAYELYMKHCFPSTGREIIKLPSTSPANAAFSLDKLTNIWKAEIMPVVTDSADELNLKELCQELSISVATGRNWLKSGRLIPHNPQRKEPLFTREYVRNFLETLQTDSQTVLKSRRNKNYISGNQFYDAYLCADSPNIAKVKHLLKLIETYSFPVDQASIGLVLAACALQLYKKSNYVNHKTSTDTMDTGCSLKYLTAYLDNKDNSSCKFPFLQDLLPNHAKTKTLLKNYEEIFKIEYTYVPQEDLLGLLYLSIRNMGNRKHTGAYYTPVNVVKQLLHNLTPPNSHDTLLDPCCGTGNFLLQLPEHWKPEQIFASDIDPVSVTVTRINLSLKFPQTDCALIGEQVQCRNFLLDNSDQRYHYIIGNPPWGYTYTQEEKKTLRKQFSSAGKNPESYDLFVEKALQQLQENGTLAFVLPEAILNVRSHKAVRQLICNNCNLEALTYLGNIFDGVWCPSVILQLVRTNQPFSVLGARISDSSKQFTIKQNRIVTADTFHLAITDEEYTLLEKIQNLPSAVTLKGNADFALGIVTGDNKQFLLEDKKTGKSDLEPVLKGSDIEKYHIKPAKYYIDFQPKQLQQCAPVELYRAQEKLVYRFIGQKLIFAYDDKQLLSLNSCNILIPRLEGLHIKYILTILNSRIAQFFVQKKWNSLKVLRSHLEQIPIPVIPEKEQNYYVEMADKLMQLATTWDDSKASSPSDQLTDLYDELDKSIAKLYQLSPEEYSLIL